MVEIRMTKRETFMIYLLCYNQNVGRVTVFNFPHADIAGKLGRILHIIRTILARFWGN
jgi:hypothetical protein